MKSKFIWMAFFMLTGFMSQAQFTYGIQLGLNATNVSNDVSSDYRDFDMPTKSKFGLNLGFIANYAFNDQMGIQTGLLYTQKGYQIDWDEFLKKNNMDGKVDGYWKYNYNYLEIPINLYYKIEQFQIMAGPYLAYGIGGKSKVDATYKSNDGSDGGTLNEEVDLVAVSGGVKAEDFLKEKNDATFIKSYNALDFGLNIGAGYQFDQFLIKAQYSLGLKNITPEITDYDSFDPNDLKHTHKGFSLSVIYLFSE